MHFQELFITRTKTEVSLAFLTVASSIAGLVSALVAQETRTAAFGVLAVLFLGGLISFAALITRPAFTVRGYKNVMAMLSRLAKTSRHSLWTVRSHAGLGAQEGSYFRAIEERLRDHADALEDFRRIVRLCPNVREHLSFLISRFYRQDNVTVLYYRNYGPQFDFMVVDGRIGVIGFPMAGGKGNVGAVVLRRRQDVAGLEIIFNQLCAESELLFDGDAHHRPQVEARLQRKLKDIFAMTAGSAQT